MFARLRANGFVGSNNQQNEVDSRSARKHVLHKALVTGHVHKTESHTTFFEEGKADIDSDAAAFLFLQAVRMRAGQCFNQRGLTVVNVTGGANDDAFEG